MFEIQKPKRAQSTAIPVIQVGGWLCRIIQGSKKTKVKGESVTEYYVTASLGHEDAHVKTKLTASAVSMIGRAFDPEALAGVDSDFIGACSAVIAAADTIYAFGAPKTEAEALDLAQKARNDAAAALTATPAA